MIQSQILPTSTTCSTLHLIFCVAVEMLVNVFYDIHIRIFRSLAFHCNDASGLNVLYRPDVDVEIHLATLKLINKWPRMQRNAIAGYNA